MEIEDKKILAEWLGWKVEKDKYGYFLWASDGLTRCDMDGWEPDENHNQFKDIWKKLTGPEMDSFNDKLKTNSPWDDHPCHLMEVYCNDPVKVLDAIIEVIKEIKITKVG